MSAHNFIDVSLFNQLVTCLVDTGSSTCLMNYKLFQKFPQLMHRLNVDYPTKVVVANGQELQVLGYINFFIKISNKPFYINALVCKDLCYDLILGSNFLKTHRSVLDLQRQTISFNKPAQAVMAHSVTVPPGTEVICQVKILGRALACLPGTIDPNMTLIHTGVAASRALVCRRGRAAPVKLLNYTNNTVTVPRGYLVGKFDPLPTMQPAIAVQQQKPVPGSSREKHLADIFSRLDFAESTLNAAEQQELKALIGEFADVFASPHIPIGKCDVIKHKIEIQEGATLPRSRPYRLSPPMKKELESHIRKMLQSDLIEPSDASHCAPVVLIRKKNGKTRFCVDYRQLNKVIKDTPHPIPTIQELFDQLSSASLFWINHPDL